jgi:hypothetical protein
LSPAGCLESVPSSGPARDHGCARWARRTAEGKTKTEIMRCLKRYTAREVFPHLLADTLTLQGA